MKESCSVEILQLNGSGSGLFGKETCGIVLNFREKEKCLLEGEKEKSDEDEGLSNLKQRRFWISSMLELFGG